MKLLYTLTLMLSIITSLYAEPHGKYCGDIIGNSLIALMNQSSHNANISVNLFGTNLNCPSESYNLSNNMIEFSQNKSDCLNKVLSEYGGCPCPPPVYFNSKDNAVIIPNQFLGNISLPRC